MATGVRHERPSARHAEPERSIRRCAAPPSAAGTYGHEGEVSPVGINGHLLSAHESPAVDTVLRAPGELLDPHSCAVMERAFKHDFSRVRVHRDSFAADSAARLHARAYTVGADIVFGPGRYAPRTIDGQRLLVHELTHVVQQSGRVNRRQRSGEMSIGPADDPAEREAVRNESMIVPPGIAGSGFGAAVTGSVSRADRTVQRAVDAAHVSCRGTGLTGGIAGGDMSGPDAVAAIRAAHDTALALVTRVVTRLGEERAKFKTPGYTATSDVALAVSARFGVDLSTPHGQHVAALLDREYTAVQGLLSGGRLRYTCRGDLCDPGDWAYSRPPGRWIYLCNIFWNNSSANLRGSTLLHEATHIWWDQVKDWGHSPLHNAHCFEQLALDLAGATDEITDDVKSACRVVP